MKITVCRLRNARDGFAADWERLVKHVRAEGSAIVLLPEMPFFYWFPIAQRFDARTWSEAVAAHDEWQGHLSELAPAVILGTRPVDYGELRYNAGFWWNADENIIETIHLKSHLSAEEGSWETSWYAQAASEFELVTVHGISIGMLIGPEIWTGQARMYGKDGAQVIAVPTVDRSPHAGLTVTDIAWLAGGRDVAQAAGAYCISSTRETRNDCIGGAAWIVAPDGQTLAITTPDEPIVTADVAVVCAPADPSRDAAPWNRA